jgi:hypothetical protein
LSHQIQASALERRITIGVLSQQPGSVRAVLADHGPARPAGLGHDLFQPGKVGGIHRGDRLPFRLGHAPGGLIPLGAAQ